MTANQRRRQRTGFSLVEILIVIVIIMVIVTVAVPRARAVRDKSNLRAARDQVASALATARAAAVQKGQQAALVMRNDSIRVSLGASGGGQLIMASRSLKSIYGADLASLPQADTIIVYDTRGFSTVSNNQLAKVYVTVEGLKDSVCVSKLGLVLKRGCAP